MSLGQSHRRLADPLGETRGEGLEILPQHARTTQVILHDLQMIETAQRALQAQAVKTVENTDDIGLMNVYKRRRDAVPRRISRASSMFKKKETT